MIKRSESKSKCSRRKHRSAEARQKRRLKMEGLEKRELLAVDVLIPTVPNIPQFTGPRNVGTVQSLTFVESETIAQSGRNDNIFNADFVPLGTGPGQNNTVDISGSMSFTTFPNDPLRFTTDIDTFAFDLRAGDILDIATLGTAGPIELSYANGTRWFGTDTPQAVFYPADSPLQTLGNVTSAMVVPETGRYFLTVAPIDTTSTYQVGLRAYRPIVEQLSIGAQQVIFLDFDGAIYPSSVFSDGSGVPQPGIVRFPSFQESLPILGLDEFDTAALNELIDKTVAEVQRQFDFVAVNGNNGDFNGTGVPGDYGVTILNSRDHADPGFHPLVTRVLVGGDAANAGQAAGLYGLSSTIDVGNFSMDDIVITVLDQASADAAAATLSPSASILDAAADLVALTISHEVGHSFGLRHTERSNTRVSIIDGGVDVNQDLGVGPDGTYGTLDDVNVDFIDDTFSIAEGYIGLNRVLNIMANTLATGTAGSNVSGRVFNDANGDGSGTGDGGLGGITVYADVNENGIADPSEPRTVSDSNGNFVLTVAGNPVNIVAVTPADFVATTPTTISSSSSLQFGFNQVLANITGTAFIDNDGNGFRDAGDTGLGGVYVYIDLDGDNVPDLGEPGTNTAADGTYSLNFPGPGTYTIRDVVPPGFEQTFPVGGEHTVTFNGTSLGSNFNFGLLPSQDFGDAPDSYRTTLASDGARHGITAGLSIGALVDRESDGQPSANANGDDLGGLDDEDGVRLLNPLGPGAAATYAVTVNNTSGVPAFLQGFMDFNRDGDFDDAGEKFASDIPVANGLVGATIPVVVNVPADASVGSSFARFRLSRTPGLGAGGFAQTGEVEDYSFPILTAARLANNDTFTVSRNTLSNQLDLLANDFQTTENPLRISNLNVTGTTGTVVLAGDAQSVFYTPPNGFIGRDVFSYTVTDSFGNSSTAAVTVNVNFQTNVPIALDDIFTVPEGASNRALNVLDNDIPSVFGGVSITSVTAGSAGGTVTIVGGGQSLRYTPPAGFNGTEQFFYSIQDAAGSSDTAQVTINLFPGSLADDQIDFTIGIFDSVNINTPVTNVQVGDDVLVRVFVEDLRLFANPEGVAAAFLDVLYTDELVATLDTDNDPTFPFDISFGPLFSGNGVFQRGDAQVPGLINEVGGLQRIDAQQTHSGPVELFTLKMRAVSPGVAVFQGDPADDAVSETVLLAEDVALTVAQQRFGRAELFIAPESDNFTSAIDDSYPDTRDSDGNLISAASVQRHRLDVLGNDNLGPTGTVREFGLVTNPTLGNVFIDNNGTPNNLNDDFLSYEPNVNANGLESFTYLIVTDDNIRSTAQVTIALGNLNANADVAYDFTLVSGDGSGTAINPASVGIGDRIGIQVDATDLRFNPSFVFAGFLDVLYNAAVLRPSDLNQGDAFNFDVQFGDGYVNDPDVSSTAIRPGIIDEVGTLFATIPVNANGLNGNEIFTLFFDVVGNGPVNVVGSPADSSPFQDTLLFNEDDPVPVSDIRYDVLNFIVGPQQNGALPQDVNNDGLVTPIDALLVINQMSRVVGEGEQAAESGGSIYYTDVNGDRRVSALDALQVINYMKQQSDSQGLAEQVAVDERQYETDLATASNDAAVEELNTDGDVVATDYNYQDPAVAGTGATGTDSAADDDEDDLLALLADDVSQQWG